MTIMTLLTLLTLIPVLENLLTVPVINVFHYLMNQPLVGWKDPSLHLWRRQGLPLNQRYRMTGIRECLMCLSNKLLHQDRILEQKYSLVHLKPSGRILPNLWSLILELHLCSLTPLRIYQMSSSQSHSLVFQYLNIRGLYRRIYSIRRNGTGKIRLKMSEELGTVQ